jgi:tetratricopeptide (TPR) repeat protein
MRIRWASAIMLGMLGGCATTPRPRPEPATTIVQLPPVEVQGDARLARMNDEELFTEGTAAAARNDFAHAAEAFGRLVDAFPKSPHRHDALMQAGLAEEKLALWDRAKAHFGELAEPDHGTGDALEASFRLAEVLYQLADYDAAAKLLARIAARTELPLEVRIQVRVQQGICELETGALDTGEDTLRSATILYQGAPRPEDLDGYYPAQAEFFLGEVYRLREEAVTLDPDQSAEQLGDELEHKAELLLSAQGHYLYAIRVGNSYWATAAGAQVGAMYETLYRYLAGAPVPKELTAEEASVYRDEVKKKIRVLLEKAISVYESTLEAADRLGTQGPFVARAREELEKLKALLNTDEPLPATPPRKPGPLHPDTLEPHA